MLPALVFALAVVSPHASPPPEGFLGRVIDVDGPYTEATDVGEPRRIEPHFRLEVPARSKGSRADTVLVRGCPLTVGRAYLVYAHARGDTLICDRVADADSIVPTHCPLHPQIPLRPLGTALVHQATTAAEAEFRRLRDSEFPYAALQFDRTQIDGWIPAAGNRAIVCALCRERALAWCMEHGASCPPTQSTQGLFSWYPEWSRLASRQGPTGFLYDDGRRLRYDSIAGTLRRYVDGLGDTTIALRLSDASRIVSELKAAGFFERDPELMEYDPMEAFDPPPGGPCGLVVLGAATDSTTHMLWWDRAYIGKRTRAIPNWASLYRVIDEIDALIKARPEYRALPPLPEGL